MRNSIVIIATIMVLVLGFGTLTWLLLTTYPQLPGLYYRQQTNKSLSTLSYLPYVSPNKTKRLLNYEYTAGNIGYEVEQGNSNFDSNGDRLSAEFIVTYDNLLSAPQSYSQAISGAIDIGCIAANDTSFKEDPRLFKSSSLTQAFYLPPFTKQQIIITVPGNCQFIGTSDGQYWWYAH